MPKLFKPYKIPFFIIIKFLNEHNLQININFLKKYKICFDVEILEYSINTNLRNHFLLVKNNANFFESVLNICNSITINKVLVYVISISFINSLLSDFIDIEQCSTKIFKHKIYSKYMHFVENFYISHTITKTEYDKCVGLLFKLLNGLININLVTKHLVWSNKLSYNMYEFILNRAGSLLTVKFSKHKYIYFINNNIEYSSDYTIFTIQCLIKKNRFNTCRSNFNTSYIKILDSKKLIFSRDLLNIASVEFEKYSEYSKNMYTEITNLYSSYSIEKSKIVYDSKIFWQTKSTEVLDNFSDDEKYTNYNYKFKLLRHNFNKKLSSIIDNFTIKCIIDTIYENDFSPIYIQHFYDFRGRVYSRSKIGPILTKFVRHIVVYEDLTDYNVERLEENIKNTYSYSIMKEFYIYLDILKLKNKNIVIMSAVVNLLIELGKIDKNLLMNRDTFSVHIEDFIKHGLELYFSNKKYDLFIENLEYLKLKFILKQLIEGNTYTNYVILKDSTASVLQHLFRWLAPKDQNALAICNLFSNHYWYDPYSYIINCFLKDNVWKITKDNVMYFKRKFLKKTIMTMCYSVTEHSAFNYFIEEINDTGILITKNLLSKLSVDFKIFFNFLKNSYEFLFYKENSKSLLNMPRILLIDGEVIDFTYYKSRKVIRDFKCVNSRDTISLQRVGSDVDLQKSNIAFIANLMHYTDSNFAKKIIKCYEIYFIHDELIVPLFQYPIILDHANFVFADFINNKDFIVFSYFIFL